jgi:hypothetical protein
MPSEAQWRDMNVTWAELKRLNWRWKDLHGSPMLPRISALLGPEHRRDALHIDSAHKSACQVFITHDTDILNKRDELSALLGIAFIDPDKDFETLSNLLDVEHGAA